MEILLVLFGVGLLSAVFSGSDDDGADAPVDGPADPDGPGTEGDDQLELGDLFDTVSGGAGDDLISGGKGFDDLSGDAGNDTLQGGDGKDLLEGGSGNDTLEGDAWHDGLFGGAGNDDLFGGRGDDLLLGEGGADELHGDQGSDVLLGGTGSDSLFGGDGDDMLVGSQLYNRELTPDEYRTLRENGPGEDINFENWGLTGNSDSASDTLDGGNGDDIFFLGNNDVASGGDGEDNHIIGTWVDDGQAPTITDFNALEDTLVLAYDKTGPVPVYGFIQGNNGGADMVANGVIVAHVQGNFSNFSALYASVTRLPI